MKIGSRIIKTAVGAGLAMYIAQTLGLNFYSSAGILTILCIETTKIRSLRTSIKRALACVVGLLFGGAFLEFTGYSPVTFSLVILLLLPLLIKLKINGGFMTSVVILLHIYTLQKLNLPIILNELGLILIGTGVALILNSFMPSLQNELKGYQTQIEDAFKKILYEYSLYIEQGDQGWDGKELIQLEAVLNKAKSLAIRKVENHLLRKEDRHYNYFEMRETQYEILNRMLPIISRLDERVPQRTMVATFLKELGEQVKEENTAYLFIKKLEDIGQAMKELPLPKTREEFETRASLFHLMNEISQYLAIKQSASELKEKEETKSLSKIRKRLFQ